MEKLRATKKGERTPPIFYQKYQKYTIGVFSKIT